jgi:hypothetical protein
MVSLAEIFERERWVEVDLLPARSCAMLASWLWRKAELGQTKRDDQCPLSDSLSHNRVLDRALENLLPKMEAITGLRLYPTYCYARVYRPGEVLKPHRDRPACEISATVTLGFGCGPVWPIFMAGRKVELPVGRAVVYRGCELEHWRETFTGEWQAQAFFHYVDANGPFKDWRYDKRSKLEHH